MWDGLKLFWRYVEVSLRSQMQYRASFIMLSLGTFLVTGIEFVGVWVLFDRFGALRGWQLAEVALFYGLVNTAFALAEAGARGFDTFDGMVRSGDFDRILLRPRSTALQIAGREFQLMRIGRFSQGLLVLIWATVTLHVTWTLPRVLLLTTAILGGACLFSGLFVLQATLAFWTVESLEVMNTMTYGGAETAQFPLTMYRDWFRKFFTFLVPLAAVTYFPALAIIGRPDPLGTSRVFQALAPFIGVAFLIVALQVWRLGVRHYHSTGS
ncbi:MAG: ABC-2 family transporter protein [Anaerolineae bacterium]|nr:ABC-2 family transporter protein [Anaerolineae bacterium]